MKNKTWGLSDVFVYSNGLIFCSVCAPTDMSETEMERITNIINPSGVNLWKISEENFSDGIKNPHKCEKYPNEDRLHYLMNC